jgi:hypothetical protein
MAPFAGPDRILADAPAQLFDLTRDPYQLQDRAAGESRAPRTQELMARLRRWHASIPWMAG